MNDLISWPFSRTMARAIKATIRSFFVGISNELAPTVLTVPEFSTPASPIWTRNNWNFLGDDVGSHPLRVALMTRWHKILWIIVPTISVNMVNDKVNRTRLTFRSHLPGNGLTAPMATVSSWSDLVEKNNSMRWDPTSRRAYWMLGSKDARVVLVWQKLAKRFEFLRSGPLLVPATQRAINPACPLGLG